MTIGASLVLLAWTATAQPAAPRVVAVSVSGVIQPVTAEILSRAVERARAEHASALLIRLNTPGGLLDATRKIVEELDASPVPVITYVTPAGGRAASAGFFLLEAGDIAAMAPGTNTGAASPVVLSGPMDPVMRSKVENDSAALLRTLTSRRGRNSDLAEETIRKAVAFTDKEALDRHLIEVVATTEAELLREIEGREAIRFDGARVTLHVANAAIVEFEPTAREKLLSAISDPNIGFMLLILGALGLYVEFSHPGLILPGVLGAVLALLGLSSLSVFPIRWIGVALLILSLALFVLEAKFASHGILGAGGAAAMLLGALMLVDGPPEVRIRLSTALAVTIPFALITVFLVSLVMRARAAKVVTGPSTMLNQMAVARTPLDPAGTVMVRGEYWNAVSSRPAAVGTQVKITAIDGLTLSVEPIEGSAERTG